MTKNQSLENLITDARLEAYQTIQDEPAKTGLEQERPDSEPRIPELHKEVSRSNSVIKLAPIVHAAVAHRRRPLRRVILAAEFNIKA